MNGWERKVAQRLMDSEYHFLGDYDLWLHTAFSQIPIGADEHVIHGFHIAGVGQRLSSILAKHSALAFTMGQADADEDCKRIKNGRKLADLPRIVFSAGKDFTPQDAITVLRNRSIALAGDVESTIVSQVKEVLLGHLTGELIRPQAEQQIAALLKTNMNRASLIVTTETTYAYNHGRLMQYRGNGVDYVQYRAVMDGRTCGICSSRNGLIAPIEEIGGDTPPVHGRCRCVLSPVFGSIQPQLLTPQAMDWSAAEPLPKGWVPADAPTASGRVFVAPGKSSVFLKSRAEEAQNDLRIELRGRIDSGEYSTEVQWNKQGRHTPGSKEYRAYTKKLGHEPSHFTVDQEKLFRDYVASALTKGRVIASGSALKESLDLSRFGYTQPVGIWYDKEEEKYVPTSWVMVVYSKNGIHFYPKRPDEGG